VALTDPTDTLAYHGARALCQHRDMSQVDCAHVAKAMNAYMKADPEKTTVPEREALWFYGMNHGVALIASKFAPLEPLPEWELAFVKKYHERIAKKSIRAFYYLLWITIREARHNGSLKDEKKLGEMEKEFGPEFPAFLTNINGGEAGISSKFLAKPPKMTIGEFCKGLAWQFYKCKWAGGYGGKKWGVVTDCLVRFVTGEFSAEMMMDTVWTLAHNGGPIFNKGQFYGMYGDKLYRILDVQRSGQIPEAVLFDAAVTSKADSELVQQMLELRARFPQAIGHYVDWYKVEALGALHGPYPKEKQAQAAEAMTPEEKAALAAKQLQAQKDAEAKEKAAAAAALKKQQEHAENWFTVMPDVEVPKFKMVRAA
jgi:uncharacterized protein YodC (DUF2158 family)